MRNPRLKAAHGHEAAERVVQSSGYLNDFSPCCLFGTKQIRRGHPRRAIPAVMEYMVFYQFPVTRTTSRRLYFEIFWTGLRVRALKSGAACAPHRSRCTVARYKVVLGDVNPAPQRMQFQGCVMHTGHGR
jgi:hypothetical protein